MDRAYSPGREEEYIEGFGGKPRGKRQLGRRRHRWENNIKMFLTEIGWVYGLDSA
jgi:hypothetical protein